VGPRCERYRFAYHTEGKQTNSRDFSMIFKGGKQTNKKQNKEQGPVSQFKGAEYNYFCPSDFE
jgi:hypothetical protein